MDDADFYESQLANMVARISGIYLAGNLREARLARNRGAPVLRRRVWRLGGKAQQFFQRTVRYQ